MKYKEAWAVLGKGKIYKLKDIKYIWFLVKKKQYKPAKVFCSKLGLCLENAGDIFYLDVSNTLPNNKFEIYFGMYKELEREAFRLRLNHFHYDPTKNNFKWDAPNYQSKYGELVQQMIHYKITNAIEVSV